jgi:hypothetical protein
MKVKELLTSARRWTKGDLARNSRGIGIIPYDSKAIRWCLLGAIDKCYPGVKERRRIYLKIRIQLGSPNCNISGWNDSPRTKFKDVKALVEKLDI